MSWTTWISGRVWLLGWAIIGGIIVTVASTFTGLPEGDLTPVVIGLFAFALVGYWAVDWYNGRSPKTNQRGLTQEGERVWADRNHHQHVYYLNAGLPCPSRKAMSLPDTAYPPYCLDCAKEAGLIAGAGTSPAT